jgi:GT2 family glycosyltransferase
MPKIGIVIVLYKQKQNLELFFESLSIQTERDFKIYFVDNNDSEADMNFSKEINSRYLLNIEYVKSHGNIGFAKGNNIGAQKAIEGGCRYIFFLNNDTELEKDCIKNLRDIHESDTGIGAASPIILYWTADKKNNVIQEYGVKVNFNKYKIIKNLEGKSLNDIEPALPEIFEADLLSGAAIFVKSEVLKRTGLWEEKYFAYGDEIDLARRIKSSGYRQVAIKDAVLWHNHNWNKENKQGWYREYYLIERNKFVYLYKYRIYFYLAIIAIEDIIKFPWRLIWFTKKCDFKLGMYYLLGILHGIFNMSGKPALKIFKQ